MAGGKTFHGLGEIESAFRDDASDSEDVRGVYSGPTVVDDDKVEEGLKKLRSLDQPPEPLTGVTEVVVDSSSSAKTKIAQLPAQGRPTAVGHSLGTPQVGQTIASDPLRGTMFGHSIHLPEINSPEDLAEELSSGSLVAEPSSPNNQLEPFPLADGATRPQGALVPRADPLYPAGGGLLPQAEPFHRANRNFRIPEDTTDQLMAPRSRALQRTAIAFVAAGVVAVGVLVWQQVREGGSDPEPAPAPAAATVEQAPAAPAEPAAAAAPAPTEGAPSPEAAAAPSPAAAAPSTREPEPAAAANPPPAEEEAPKRTSRSSRRRGSRAAAAATAAAADDNDAAPAKPARPAKPKDEEDPDATLPPSLD